MDRTTIDYIINIIGMEIHRLNMETWRIGRLADCNEKWDTLYATEAQMAKLQSALDILQGE